MTPRHRLMHNLIAAMVVGTVTVAEMLTGLHCFRNQCWTLRQEKS